MMNKLKIIILNIFLLIICSLPVLSKENDISAYDLLNNQNTIQEQSNIDFDNNIDIQEEGRTDLKPNINENIKNNNEISSEQQIDFKKTVKKFLYAMLGVALSSLILFIGLSIYNKLRASLKKTIKLPDNKSSLAAPDNINEAVKIFLNTTKWI